MRERGLTTTGFVQRILIHLVACLPRVHPPRAHREALSRTLALGDPGQLSVDLRPLTVPPREASDADQRATCSRSSRAACLHGDQSRIGLRPRDSIEHVARPSRKTVDTPEVLKSPPQLRSIDEVDIGNQLTIPLCPGSGSPCEPRRCNQHASAPPLASHGSCEGLHIIEPNGTFTPSPKARSIALRLNENQGLLAVMLSRRDDIDAAVSRVPREDRKSVV